MNKKKRDKIVKEAEDAVILPFAPCSISSAKGKKFKCAEITNAVKRLKIEAINKIFIPN